MKNYWFSLLFGLLLCACTTPIQANRMPANSTLAAMNTLALPNNNTTPTTSTATRPVSTTVSATAPMTATDTTTGATTLPDTAGMTIGEIINTVDNFSMLATTVDTAGMALAFNADGPLTVFAPGNAAFAALPTATRAALLADPVQLAQILQYHIVVDQANSTQLARLDTVPTAAGEPITITIGVDGELRVDGAQIVYTDLLAANGVIHVINQILTPPSLNLVLPAAAPETLALKAQVPDDTLEELKQADTSQETVVAVINSISGLKTAATAIAAAGMTDALQGRGPFTLFVPTDPAFQEMPAEQIEALLNNRAALADRLRYHLVLGDINSADLAKLPTVLTASGEALVITVQENGQIFVNGVPVYQADIEASNGTIHVIGGVLTPPSDNSVADASG